MKSRKHTLPLILFIFFAISHPLLSQQQVDVSSIDESLKGGFFRVNFGIAPLNFTKIDVTDKESYTLVPISFDFVAGKRLGRAVAPYFRVGGHVLIKETTNFTSFSQAGMNIGCNIYYRNPNTYIAPEAGLAIVNYEYYPDPLMSAATEDIENIGVDIGLRAGRDWHVSGKFYLGTQLYLAYFNSWTQEVTHPKGSGFFYGVNLSLKFGK